MHLRKTAVAPLTSLYCGLTDEELLRGGTPGSLLGIGR
jgi:hypothetical protein